MIPPHDTQETNMKNDWLASIPGIDRAGGTYVVATDSGHWGRGDGIEAAVAACHEAGAMMRTLHNRKCVAIWWQADSDWQAHLERYPAAKCSESGAPYGTDRRPRIDQSGSIAYFSHPDTHKGAQLLYSPASGVVDA